MGIDAEQVVALVKSAGRLVGVKEILRAGSLSSGEQATLKRILRDLVKEGRIERRGKRFGIVGRTHSRISGPAWSAREPAQIRVHLQPGLRRPAGQAPGHGAKDEAPRGQGPKGRIGKETTRRRIVEGVINHHPDGFAFVRSLTDKSEDVFVPPGEARKAIDHDRVVIEVSPQRGGRTIGRIVEVKRRTRQHVIGTYWEKRGKAWVEPRETELGLIDVPKTQLARPGDVVKVRLGIAEKMLEAREHRLTGEVKGSLGNEADHSIEVLSVAYSRGFQDEFSDSVMDEADGFAMELSPKDLKGRRDLRELQLITIDGEDARDFDDAISVEAIDVGWRLVVAIADVSHYVTPKSALDAEALSRSTSVYLPGRVLPMLPERLSNGLCSLKPDEDRLCMVADLTIDRGGHTVQTELFAGVMRSQARCTYTEVHRILLGESVPGRMHLKPMLVEAHALSQTLHRMRMQRGAVDFDLPETRPELDEQGLPTRLVRRERWESHRLVEECMLAANEAVAREFRKAGRTTVHRFHGEPDADRLGAFLQLLSAYGVRVPQGKLGSKQLNTILAELEGHPEQRALHQLALRSMMQAVYSSESSGHYGLGAKDYLHFTSPIRRYPDLLVHRLLKQWWKSKHELSDRELDELESMAQHASERERAAMLVEREVNALYSCLLMKARVGESFDATVSSLSENGFFVEIDELYVEGLVKGETVFPKFDFDVAKYRMVFGSGQVVKVGHRCRVTLVSVNLKKKQMDFVVEAFADGTSAPQKLRNAPRAGDRQGQGRRMTARQSMASRSSQEAVVRNTRQNVFGARTPKAEKPTEERADVEVTRTTFDARAVLDRLWQERGSKPKAGRSQKPGSTKDKRTNRRR